MSPPAAAPDGVGPEEAAARKAAGAQYIVRANAKQFLDAEAHPDQRGRYANDGGKQNNARIRFRMFVIEVSQQTIREMVEFLWPCDCDGLF